MIGNTEAQSSGISLILLFVIIIFISSRRLQKGIQGRKFRGWRVIFSPLLYLLITLYILIIDWKDFGIYIDISILFILIIGLMTGIRYGESVSFFKKGKDLYFKRSPYIISIWTISFIARITIEFAFPKSLLYTEIVDYILTFTSGLIIGESFHIITKRREFG
jgi:hypothetical protein